MKEVSLNELMGKHGGQLSLDNLKEVLGDAMPELPLNNVGKIRLLAALKQRFGENFMNIPGVKHIISEFDKEANVDLIIRKTKAGRL